MKYEPIPGQTHNPSEEETMSVIRSVLTESAEPTPSRSTTRAERKAERKTASDDCITNDNTDGSKLRAFVERNSETHPQRRASDLPELHPQVDVVEKQRFQMPKLGAAVVGFFAPMISKVRSFKPSTRLVALLSMALLVALRPHWFVITGVLVVALLVASFLMLGSQRIWRMAVGWLNRVEARDPARAERLRVSLDGFACRWDSILDVFPDGMVDGLYMPDLQAMQNAEEAHTAAVDARLNQMAQES
ncbi:MAG: hypothetical protein ABJR46_11660 [Tateyamaria sp.]|uniref:hypothetical protein n=1 Tax=Tateyamaria sp. TaxID=1929288 RepID=UPI0032A07E51